MKIIVVQLDKDTSRMRISIVNREGNEWLHIDHFARELRMVFLLISARKRDIVYGVLSTNENERDSSVDE